MRRPPPRRPLSPGSFLPARRAPPRGRKSNSRRGTQAEGTWGGKGATAVLRAEGYNPMPSHGGFTAADVNANKFDPRRPGPSTRRVQVKRRAVYAPSMLNDGVLGWLGWGRHRAPDRITRDEQREVWGYADNLRAWAARVIVRENGRVTAIDGAKAKEVIASIERMLARERTKRTQAPTTFRARLTKGLPTVAKVIFTENTTPEIEFGVWDAEVVGVEDAVSKFDPNQPQIVISYALETPDGAITAREWVTVGEMFSPRSKLYGRVSALLFNGGAPEPGYELDTDDFVGHECRVQWGSFVKKNGERGQGITDVLPPKPKRAPARAPARAQPARAQAAPARARRQVTEEDIDELD